MTRAAAAGLAASAACLLVLALRDRRPRQRERDGTRGAAAALSALAHLRRALPWLVGLFSRRDARLAIQRAGLDGQITARDIAAARVACVLFAALLTPRLATMLPLRMLPIALPVLFWAASELPLHLLARRATRRGAAMREALPDALDLLRACLAAGLPLRRSLSLVADHCAEPVAAEFACVAAETAFGIPQSTALDGLAARNPEPEVRALVSAIRQAERNGSPLAPVIAAQAGDARTAHNRAIIERGARAGPKIQLVVSATIVPGALIGLAAIVIAAIARGELRLL
ncbi:MAG: type II secretion system F family protein [Thermoleophilaceae bacterium]|nr:type II secretion system F family protein [Thermoleophilaceae bacterium]